MSRVTFQLLPTLQRMPAVHEKEDRSGLNFGRKREEESWNQTKMAKVFYHRLLPKINWKVSFIGS